MSDHPLRPFDDLVPGRVLDAQDSFGRRDGTAVHGLQAQSPAMQLLVRSLERLAPHARAMLVSGESGAGKRTVAAAAFRLGPCRGGAQITVLGADDREELARLRDAARGSRTPLTCFVPEVGDLTHDHQAALVRGLDASALLPLGEGLHVIAASAFEPARAMAEGLMRADLVHRLTAVRLQVPALAERREDLVALATTLLRDACRTLRLPERTWSGAALAVLEGRRWPGNVRELRHAALRAAALSDDMVIGAHTAREACGPEADLAIDVRRRGGAAGAEDEQERARVVAALAAAGGNKSAAAVTLGVSRRAFYRMLDRLGA